MAVKTILGFDCGNSSYRVVLGKYDGERIITEVIDQIPNDMIKVGNYYYWDILRIFSDFKQILKRLVLQGEKIDSIGICTWGVDFALFDKKGNMLNNPLAYRNVFGEAYISKLTTKDRKDMFQNTGILCDKINSVYLLEGMKEEMPDIYELSDKLLMIPDILNYMLTGRFFNEPSEFSTTQLMNVKSKEVSEFVCHERNIKKELFQEIGRHGELIGVLLEDIKEEIGVDYDIPVVCVPSHDTAAAVLAVPAMEEHFAFISSGTWSLIGTELKEPILSDEVYQANLTNELGAFHTITLLKNGAGMFMIQKIKKEYELDVKKEVSWTDIMELSNSYQEEHTPLIDINDIRFFHPRKMGKEIWSYLKETKQADGEFLWNTVVRAVYASMACSYAITVNDMQNVTKKSFDSIYIVGGGAKNEIVNQMTADCTGKKVIACIGESTAMGNIAAQLKYFDTSLGVKDIRKIVKNSVHMKSYSTNKDTSYLVDCYKKLSEKEWMIQ
ncbi:rhamnulokinase [Lachnotalea glycerini]|uniref:Rhamnulokinase n=1 Tax=Lachnotalea glycerini TaxID=1763509 RepID=A0A371JJ97_9FIRM|nr:rhamnulokinase family protein [Lachnotalea glycerini]RDY32811.1 rhamnulokinase [Lachnotalea glycerini]